MALNAGWKTERLGDLARIQNGYAFDSARFSPDSGMPLIRIRDLKEGRSTETNYIGKFGAQYVINQGDFLIGMDGEFGCYEWQGAPALLNQRVCRLYAFSSQLDPRFLFRGINKHLKVIEDKTSFTTVKHISSKQIENIPIGVPPLAEQQRIVAILDEAFEAIATATVNAEKNLCNARELFEAVLKSTFAELASISPLAVLEALTETPITYGVVKPGAEGTVAFVRGGDISKGRVRVERLRTITEAVSADYKRTLLRGGELLICLVGQPGQVAVAPAELRGANIARQVGLIRLKANVEADYVRLFLQSPAGQKSLGAKQSGSVQQVINLAELRRLEIPILHSEKQKTVVNRLLEASGAAAELESDYIRKLAALAELKQSLLARAFSGELTASVSAAAVLAPANDNAFATPEHVANIIAFAHQRHEAAGRQNTFGRVKAQKNLHLVESIGGVELGRGPWKDAAGPNDSQHMRRAEAWAKERGFFEFRQRADGGYDFKKLVNYATMMTAAKLALAPIKAEVARVTDLLTPLDSGRAEVLATVHAAWNNLVLDGAEATDDAIVREARDDWHDSKMKIAESKFLDAIKLIRRKGIVPDGSAKRVAGQPKLL